MEIPNINPWLHIWTQPRKTMRLLLARPNYMVLFLALAGGVVSLLAWLAFPLFQDPAKSKLILLIFIVIGGGIIGILNLYFGSWLYRLTGSWVGGKGTFVQTKCAVGWSNYPVIVGSIFLILSTISANNLLLQGLFSILNTIVTVWSFITFIHLLAEVHQFSVWKSLLSMLIAFILLFVMILLIVLLIPLLKPLFI